MAFEKFEKPKEDGINSMLHDAAMHMFFEQYQQSREAIKQCQKKMVDSGQAATTAALIAQYLEKGDRTFSLGRPGEALSCFKAALDLQKPGKERALTYLSMGACYWNMRYEGSARTCYEAALSEIDNDKSLDETERRKLRAFCYAGIAETYGPDFKSEAPLSDERLKRQEYLAKAAEELRGAEFTEKESAKDLRKIYSIYGQHLELEESMRPYQPERTFDLEPARQGKILASQLLDRRKD